MQKHPWSLFDLNQQGKLNFVSPWWVPNIHTDYIRWSAAEINRESSCLQVGSLFHSLLGREDQWCTPRHGLMCHVGHIAPWDACGDLRKDESWTSIPVSFGALLISLWFILQNPLLFLLAAKCVSVIEVSYDLPASCSSIHTQMGGATSGRHPGQDNNYNRLNHVSLHTVGICAYFPYDLKNKSSTSVPPQHSPTP